MSVPVTPQEHPFTARVLHWTHLASFLYLAVSGVQIHLAEKGSPALETLDRHHMVGWMVFLGSAAARVAWAFLGDGSAAKGSTLRIPDWMHFTLGRGDGAGTAQWFVRYATFQKHLPDVAKYNPLQRTVYALLFPLAILASALTGLTLTPDFTEAFTWLPPLLGGENGVRVAHEVAMGAIVVLSAVHLYAGLKAGFGRVSMMMLGWTPARYRAGAPGSALEPKDSPADV